MAVSYALSSASHIVWRNGNLGRPLFTKVCCHVVARELKVHGFLHGSHALRHDRRLKSRGCHPKVRLSLPHPRQQAHIAQQGAVRKVTVWNGWQC